MSKALKPVVSRRSITKGQAALYDLTSDYLRGYREMEAKIGFELNRLKKLKESK